MEARRSEQYQRETRQKRCPPTCILSASLDLAARGVKAPTRKGLGELPQHPNPCKKDFPFDRRLGEPWSAPKNPKTTS